MGKKLSYQSIEKGLELWHKSCDHQEGRNRTRLKDEIMKHEYIVEGLESSYILHPEPLRDFLLREASKTPLGLKKVWLGFPPLKMKKDLPEHHK